MLENKNENEYVLYDDELVKQLNNQGKTNIEISKQLGCAKSTVTYILKKYGVGRNMKDIMVDKDEVFRLHSEGFSNPEIGKILGRNDSTIFEIIKAAGLVGNKTKVPRKGLFTTTKEELEEMLKTKKIPEIANQLQKSVQCIYSKIKEFGISK